MWAGVLIALAAVAAQAQQATPAGLWKTIDDHTQRERSLVRITEAAGVFSGTIDKSLNPDDKPGRVCEECSDERKGKPLIGLQIIRNIHKNADDPAIFDGGDILDPENGKVYRLRLKPIDGGTRLEVRGYLGPFWRTQTWIRVE